MRLGPKQDTSRQGLYLTLYGPGYPPGTIHVVVFEKSSELVMQQVEPLSEEGVLPGNLPTETFSYLTPLASIHFPE